MSLPRSRGETLSATRAGRARNRSSVVGIGGNGQRFDTQKILRIIRLRPGPIIRNEELILLRAEANIGLNNVGPAIADIDLIRVQSGGLAPSSGLNASNILDELLKQKRYSLLFEGGHRWIDLRRYGKLDSSHLAIDTPDDVIHASFPIPLTESQAQ